MANIATIHDRIALLVKEKAGNKNTVFAQTLGVSEANIRGYVKGVVPKADVLAKIVRTYDDINPAWLLTGEGEMLKSSTPSTDGATPKAVKSEKISGNAEDTTALISFMREQATAHREELKEKEAFIKQQNQKITDLKCEVTRLEGENRHLNTENQNLHHQVERLEGELQQYRPVSIPPSSVSTPPALTASTQEPTEEPLSNVG